MSKFYSIEKLLKYDGKYYITIGGKNMKKFNLLSKVKNHLESGGQVWLNIISELGSIYNADNEEALFLLMRLNFHNLKSLEDGIFEDNLIIIIHV